MKTTEFILLYNPCNEGNTFALQFETMSEVWEACQRPDWMFYILEKHKPLEKEQSVRLAIAFAETALINWTDKNDDRPLKAIEAAKDWLDNPCDETISAAWSAARSARSAARSARSARSAAESAAESARSAAWSARSAARSAESAAESAARSAAESAARSAARSARSAAESAWSAARSNQCNLIRESIPNPFK